MAIPQRLQSRTAELLSLCLLGALSAAVSVSPALAKGQWHICKPFEKRITCVVDGDTLWYQGEKMRLRGVDTPEVDGACPHERMIAQQATEFLVSLLSRNDIVITRFGLDRHDRRLVTIYLNTGTAGQALLDQGLAERYGASPQTNWCQ